MSKRTKATDDQSEKPEGEPTTGETQGRELGSDAMVAALTEALAKVQDRLDRAEADIRTLKGV